MELKDFIVKTITDISEGLSEAHLHIKEKNLGRGIVNSYKTVKFDIGVTVQEDSKAEGGGKVSVVNVLSAGGSKSSSTMNAQTSRIEFSVELYLNGHEHVY